MKKLYEIRAEVSYCVVIAANSEKEALEHVKTWEHAWDSNSDLKGVSTPDIVDIREPTNQENDTLEFEAHEVI